VPAKVGNWENLSVVASVKKESATHCDRCYCPLDSGPERLRCGCARQ
jgi:hypothetical protein